MRQLIAKDHRNKERIFPYIGGEEVNESPTHAHHRFVINFEDFPLHRADLGSLWVDANEEKRKAWLQLGSVPIDYPDPVAADWPDLLGIVELKVKPERLAQKDALGAQYWWRFLRLRAELRAVAGRLARVLVCTRHQEHFALGFLPTEAIFADSLVVITNDRWNSFAIMQSRVHETWARFFGSSLEDRFRYTPSDCFDTFPMPSKVESDSVLEQSGSAYYEFRATLMRNGNRGLTTTYNGFHDPDCDDSGILRLREMHDAMDRVVLDAYGWTDIKPKCEFILQFDEDHEEDDNGRQHKQKYRYRWPDEVHDEVLAALLKLNRERAVEEGQSDSDSQHPTMSRGADLKKSKVKRAKQISAAAQLTMSLSKE